MKKKILAFFLCVAMGLTGCAGATKTEENKENKPEQQSTKNEKSEEEQAIETKLGLITPSAYDNVMGLNLEPGSFLSIIGRGEDSAYWNELQAGVQQAADDLNKELGYEKDDKIKVTYNAPSKRDDVSDQVNILDEELARYPDAVAISIIDASACQVQFDLALENGIPIVAYDSGTGYQNIAATCSTDNKAAGAEAAERTAELLEDTGEVALIVHDSKSTTAMDRESGFKEKMRETYPNITIGSTYHLDDLDSMKQTVADYYNSDTDAANDIDVDAVEQSTMMQYILDTHPGLKACVATSEETTNLIVEALNGSEASAIKVIGFDGGETNLKYLKDGKIEGFILQNPFGMGYAAVVASARAGLGVGNEAMVNTGFVWVNKENYKEKNIEKLLYE